jgi:hypothetical protein
MSRAYRTDDDELVDQAGEPITRDAVDELLVILVGDTTVLPNLQTGPK